MAWTEEQTAQLLAAMAESSKQLALATAELNDTNASFCRVFGVPLIVPANAVHADAPPCSLRVTDSTDQPTRVQLDDDIRKDNDAHVRGQPLFSFAKDRISDVLDPERVKKDDDVVELTPASDRETGIIICVAFFLRIDRFFCPQHRRMIQLCSSSQ